MRAITPRIGCAAALLAAAAAVSAQGVDRSGSTAMPGVRTADTAAERLEREMQRRAGIPDERDRMDHDALMSVWAFLDKKDCAGAVKALNAGLAGKRRSVMLLAGAMYEGGVCLKPNWDRAVALYQQAHEAGHPRAAAKLVAGYASTVGGPDPAATLWWAVQGRVALPAPCASVAPLASDAERFVAELKRWPVSQVQGCAYTAGVMATIQADSEFTAKALAHGVKGKVRVDFVPSQARVDTSTIELETVQLGGLVSGDALRDRDSRQVRAELENSLREAADRALKRLPQPAGIDPAWKVSATYVFSFYD
jgi:TPR repeat protein